MKMDIYTNENNTSTLKLLIAANFGNKKVTLKSASLADIKTGPRQLPYLEVDEELLFFSSNAAVQYLFSDEVTQNGMCQQMQEWEATRLYPIVQNIVTGKVAPDVKQMFTSLMQEIENVLSKKKFILGDKLTPADISIWCTLYTVYYNSQLNAPYLVQFDCLRKWIEEVAAMKPVQDAIKQWGGCPTGPFSSSSSLGVPSACPHSPTDSDDFDEASLQEINRAKDNWFSGSGNMQKPLVQDKVVLPLKDRKNILITSALPYVNNVPHLGNIIGCVLSADIFARYCRLCDYNTLFICGTDEYGTATETKALEEKLTPRQICDKYYQIHNDVYRWFNIGFDYFGRTSTPEQTEITQRLFLKLKENGFISEQSVDQLLCQKCDRFLADRFVEGTCPTPGCGYESARGDQCDKCGKLVNATDLVQPRCKQCGETPVLRSSEQQFLELPLLSCMVHTWSQARASSWSAIARSVLRAWLKEGLRPRAITRDLKWGVPVPLPNYSDKVFYVWFDAPIGYLSITQCCTKDYEKWWKPEKDIDVKLYQFMAKDNVPFHSVMFPAVLLGANEGYILVDHLFATEYLNYEEGKFSKSRGVGVFGNDAKDTGIPSDVWRFYLASIRPESSDSSFSWVELGTRNNSELLNNLGNFCHRSLSFCSNAFKGKVPDLCLKHYDFALIALINRDLTAYVQHMEKGRLREALKHVLLISKLGNHYMQSEQPWVLLKGNDVDKTQGATAIGICCQIVALLCTLIAPYMPDTYHKLKRQLNISGEKLRLNPVNPSFHPYLPSGHVIGKPEPLFAKLEPTLLEELKKKYAGTQMDRVNKENNEKPVKNVISIPELEAAITKQGEKVRQLKSSTKDKSVLQPEINVLLDLKKQLAIAQQDAVTAKNGAKDTKESLEKAIQEQGDKVRRLKASTKDKALWTPEVNVLLDLKKKLAELNK